MPINPAARGGVSSFIPVGAEIQVNTTTANNQEKSQITWLANGTYVVTWESLNQDGSSDGVYARVFNADGTPVTGEIQMHDTVANSQVLPQVVAINDGRFVGIWGNGSDIFYQVFENDGTKLAPERTVHTHTTGTQNNFSVDLMPDGGFFVSWDSIHQDGSFSGAYGQRFNHFGGAIYTELQFNTYTAGNQSMPSIAGLTNGSFVAVWGSAGQVGSPGDRGIYLQQYSSTNTAVGMERVVFDTASNSETDPEVVALSGGGFGVLYRDATDSELWVKLYSQTGAEIAGGHKMVSPVNGFSSFNHAQAVALSDDRFVVTWETHSTSGDVRYQVVHADGTFGPGGVVHSNTALLQNDAVILKLPQGGFAIAYRHQRIDGVNEDGVAITRFNEDGDIIGLPSMVEFQVNTHTTSVQFDPAFSVNDAGEIVITWTSVGQDGNNNGIYVQVLQTPTLGTNGDDTMNGTSGDDFLGGWHGNDVIFGKNGDDRLEGGEEKDTLYGGGGDDDLRGGYRSDSLFGGDGADTLYGSFSDDHLHGGKGADELYGEEKRDNILGASGDDMLDGGGGADTLRGGTGNDDLHGRGAADELYGDEHADTLNGDNGNDTLDGGSGADLLIGGRDKDTLYGGAGGDDLRGGRGADEIHGGTGNDVMQGQRGGDTFVFTTQGGTDTITDFTLGSDELLLDDALWGNTAKTAAQIVADHATVSGGDVLLNFSLSGEEIRLTGVTNLSALESDIFTF